jgi:hypothetical protein
MMLHCASLRCQAGLDRPRWNDGRCQSMWARVCIGLLVLAMVASGATVSHAHLHTGNGHRVAHDHDHAGDPAQSLWHSHGAPHAHDAEVHAHAPAASVPDGHGDHGRPEGPEDPEDVVSVGGTVASAPSPAHEPPPVHFAIIVAGHTLDIPVRAWTGVVGALPRVHAPPLITPSSPRAPPTFAHLHL